MHEDVTDSRRRAQIAQDLLLEILRRHGGSHHVSACVDEVNAGLPGRWRRENQVDFGRGAVTGLENYGKIVVGSDGMLRIK